MACAHGSLNVAERSLMPNSHEDVRTQFSASMDEATIAQGDKLISEL